MVCAPIEQPDEAHCRPHAKPGSRSYTVADGPRPGELRSPAHRTAFELRTKRRPWRQLANLGRLPQVWRYSARVPPVFLQSWGPLLVVTHSLSSIVLCGASVHQVVLAMLAWKGRSPRRQLLRVYSVTTLLSYLVTVFVGALLYPRYRVFIRALFLDRHAAWAANLFDLKENLATLGFPLAVGALLLAWSLSRADLSTDARGLRLAQLTFLVMAVGTALIVGFNVIAGLLCTSVRGA